MDFNRLSMFKLPNKHKRFEYVPRHYDERKEALKKKIEQAERINKGELSNQSRREISFRAKTEDKWGNSDYKSASMRQNLRLIIILGILVAAVYFIFIGIDSNQIEPVLEKLYD